jgi:alpha-1,2-mannosyltransferase
VSDEGHVAVFRSPGAIAVAVPGYLLRGGGSDPADFSILPSALTAAVLAVLALILFWLAIRDPLGDIPAASAVLLLGFTTPFWSVNANSLWPHALTLFGISGMSWATVRERWWLVGLFGGLALWGRLHMTVVVALLGLGLAIWRRKPALAIKVGLVSGGLMFLAAAWSHWMYGNWSPQGPYPSGRAYVEGASVKQFQDHVVNQLGLWVSPDRGLLVWTPVVLLMLPAVGRAWRDLPDWTRLLATSGVAYAFIQGFLNGFGGGSGFYGYRLTLETLACLFPAIALSTPFLGRFGRVAVGPLIGLQFSAIALGAITEGFFVTTDRAWHDNSLALALRTYPFLWTWVVLCIAMGYLMGRILTQRHRMSETVERITAAT